jgi:histidine triad (HIT) family protein
MSVKRGDYYFRTADAAEGAWSLSTIFSRIISGELPATIVYQDDLVTAFRDIQPVAPVHILIVPNKEIATVNDLTDEDERVAGRLFLAARKIAEQEGIAESGYRLIVNCNRDGGQEVYHLHMHLVGGRRMGPIVAKPSEQQR